MSSFPAECIPRLITQSSHRASLVSIDTKLERDSKTCFTQSSQTTHKNLTFTSVNLSSWLSPKLHQHLFWVQSWPRAVWPSIKWHLQVWLDCKRPHWVWTWCWKIYRRWIVCTLSLRRKIIFTLAINSSANRMGNPLNAGLLKLAPSWLILPKYIRTACASKLKD